MSLKIFVFLQNSIRPPFLNPNTFWPTVLNSRLPFGVSRISIKMVVALRFLILYKYVTMLNQTRGETNCPKPSRKDVLKIVPLETSVNSKRKKSRANIPLEEGLSSCFFLNCPLYILVSLLRGLFQGIKCKMILTTHGLFLTCTQKILSLSLHNT